MLEHAYPEDYSPSEGPILEQGNSVKRKEKQKGTVMDGPQLPFPIIVHHLSGQ